MAEEYKSERVVAGKPSILKNNAHCLNNPTICQTVFETEEDLN